MNVAVNYMVKKDVIARKFLSINTLFVVHYKQKQLPSLLFYHSVALSFSL
jgi:hypothetical protein